MVFPTPWRYAEDVVVFIGEDASGEARPARLIALNRDGQTLWERDAGAANEVGAHRGLLVLREDGELFGIEPETLTEHWRIPIPAHLYATAIGRSNVYFSGGCVEVSLPD